MFLALTKSQHGTAPTCKRGLATGTVGKQDIPRMKHGACYINNGIRNSSGKSPEFPVPIMQRELLCFLCGGFRALHRKVLLPAGTPSSCRKVPPSTIAEWGIHFLPAGWEVPAGLPVQTICSWALSYLGSTVVPPSCQDLFDRWWQRAKVQANFDGFDCKNPGT